MKKAWVWIALWTLLVLVGSGAAFARTSRSSTPSEAQSDSEVLRTVVDQDLGITWSLVTYQSFDGRCFDVLAVDDVTDKQVGGFGGCGFDEPFDSVLGRAGAPDQAPAGMAVLGGRLVVDRNGSSFSLDMAAGIATCACQVNAHLDNGTEVSDQVTNGVFLAYATGTAPSQASPDSESAESEGVVQVDLLEDGQIVATDTP